MGKPLYEDEAVAGLIAMRPLGEVLETVLVDRGGAPLHFVLAHAVFWIDTSAEALRWLSVACAVAAVPLCFDLGRRLGGSVAGIVAAAVAASSTALAVYGSFGRMYALYVLVAALAADLFVRAVHLRSRGAVIAAAAAAWLLPAVHPYGAIPALAELVVAAILWRRRSIRDGLPVAVAALAALPFFLADLRLADRAEVGSGDGDALATPGDAWSELLATLSAFAGGDGLPLVSFTALALVGLAVAARREPAFFAVAVTVAAPPVLFLLLRSESAPDLSPRHLFFGLPLWAAAIGMGAGWLGRWLPRAAWQILVAAIVLLAISAPPSALRDPRALGLTPSEVEVAVQAGPDDVLFPYSIAFLANLGDVRQALALPQEPSAAILAALEHGEQQIGTVFVAIPRERWTVVTREGPFDKSGALLAAAEAVARSDHPAELDWWFDLVERDLCEALEKLGRSCPA